MYHNKVEENSSVVRENIQPIEITNKGARGVMEATLFDYEQSYMHANKLFDYAGEREMTIASEHERETEIFQKVLTYKSR